MDPEKPGAARSPVVRPAPIAESEAEEVWRKVKACEALPWKVGTATLRLRLRAALERGEKLRDPDEHQEAEIWSGLRDSAPAPQNSTVATAAPELAEKHAVRRAAS